MANGIPSLLGEIANVTNTISLVVADAELILGLFAGPQWGLFNLDGSIAIQPDSIVSLDAKREWSVPNYPQEQGAFQSYNKVMLPLDTNIRMTKGGTDDQRHQFLISLSTLAKSLKTFNVGMSEGRIILNATIIRFDFRRTSTNGVGLLTVDVALQEIRVAPNPAFTNTAQPSGADPAQGGAVQPQSKPAATSASSSYWAAPPGLSTYDPNAPAGVTSSVSSSS